MSKNSKKKSVEQGAPVQNETELNEQQSASEGEAWPDEDLYASDENEDDLESSDEETSDENTEHAATAEGVHAAEQKPAPLTPEEISVMEERAKQLRIDMTGAKVAINTEQSQCDSMEAACANFPPELQKQFSVGIDHLKTVISGRTEKLAEMTKEYEALIPALVKPINDRIDDIQKRINLMLAERNEMIALRNLWDKKTETKAKKENVKDINLESKSVLVGVIPAGGIKISATYKGQNYEGIFFNDEKVTFDDESFKSPTTAAKGIAGSVNGWQFWKIQNREGKMVPLDTLREKVAETAAPADKA